MSHISILIMIFRILICILFLSAIYQLTVQSHIDVIKQDTTFLPQSMCYTRYNAVMLAWKATIQSSLGEDNSSQRSCGKLCLHTIDIIDTDTTTSTFNNSTISTSNFTFSPKTNSTTNIIENNSDYIGEQVGLAVCYYAHEALPLLQPLGNFVTIIITYKRWLEALFKGLPLCSVSIFINDIDYVGGLPYVGLTSAQEFIVNQLKQYNKQPVEVNAIQDGKLVQFLKEIGEDCTLFAN